MANVLFLQGTQANYDAMKTAGTLSATTFYYADSTNLYLGELKLSNAADLASAVSNIAQNAADIVTINNQLTAWGANESTSGSIAYMIKTAVDALDGELASVAKSGAASDVSVSDAGGLLDATNVESALAELAQKAVNTNGATVFKGSVASLPTSANVGDAYIVDGVLSVCTTASTTSPTWTELAINSVITGTGFETEGATGVDPTSLTIKQYIDKLIFVGTQSEYNTAKAAGTLLENTFAVITDEDAEQFIPITTAEITALY